MTFIILSDKLSLAKFYGSKYSKFTKRPTLTAENIKKCLILATHD